MNYGFGVRDTVGNGTTPARWRYRPLVLNVAFWTLFGVLQSATWILSPIGDRYPHPSSLIASALFNAYLWAILTPFLFPLATRVSQTRRRAGWIAFVLVLGLGVSAVVALVAAKAHTVLSWGPEGPPPRPSGYSLWALSRWYFEEVVLFFLVFGAGVATDMARRFRAREREAARLEAQASALEAERAELNARLADARLALVRSQLNPHFLFNTLNAVSALVVKDPKGVRDMIALLSELLRSALTAADDEEEISVEREMALVRLYLEILEIRYQGQLRTSIVRDADTQDALVPRMILQPLVENAMKHGVAPGGEGCIEIRVARAGDDLALSVQDTGAGISKLETTDGAGVGLRLTRERLSELYGCDQKLELLDAPGGGTIARILLPFHTSADLRVAAEPE